MSADGKTALDALAWGTSTGGAAGSSETTSTLGVDRQDARVPPDLTRVWAAQINATKNFCLAVSQTFKGATRLGCLPQSSNPFGSGESGYYIDNSGNPYVVYNGTRTLLGTTPPVPNQVTGVIVNFSATDTATFTFSTPGGTYGKSATATVTDGSGQQINVTFAPDSSAAGTTTGTVKASAPFTGFVTVAIYSAS